MISMNTQTKLNTFYSVKNGVSIKSSATDRRVATQAHIIRKNALKFEFDSIRTFWTSVNSCIQPSFQSLQALMIHCHKLSEACHIWKKLGVPV